MSSLLHCEADHTAHSHPPAVRKIPADSLHFLFSSSAPEENIKTDAHVPSAAFVLLWSAHTYNMVSPEVRLFLRFSTDTFHIRSKKRIHTGNTDHHNGRFLLKTFTDFCHCFWNLFQMSSRYNIRLIHHQIKKTVMIRLMKLITDVFRPQHPGATISMIESGTASPALFTPNPSAPWRVKAKRRRRTVDKCVWEMNCSGMFSFPSSFQFFYRTKICFLSHSFSSSFHKIPPDQRNIC